MEPGGWDGGRDHRPLGALAAAARLGPFFAVEPEPAAGSVSWAALVEEPSVLSRRVEELTGLLATGPGAPEVPARVVASLAHLGLLARLLSPLLGAALLADVLPVTSSPHVHVRPHGENPLPLALTEVTGLALDGAPALAAALATSWLQPVVEPLAAAVRTGYGVSRQVLDGNVASAAAGALRAAATARPGLTERADALLDALLEGPLAGRGRRRPDGSFLRRSCCLFYRVPGAGTCGDCILRGDRGRVSRRPEAGATSAPPQWQESRCGSGTVLATVTGERTPRHR